ncbi:MAG: zinc ribbon domain-containing protein [Planctomycetes bacterium]|jgi:putative FmdB family regulatory protein|nr:zinc ribbon domain-containing protein [Planctomycetota bacterium]
MPTYDYLCAACGHRFEEFQSMSAKALRKCPACKKSKLDRLIGAGAGVIFKGSGFYQTDYRPSSYTADAKKDDSSPAPAPAGGCAPTCGTPNAPAGCSMPKTKTKE